MGSESDAEDVLGEDEVTIVWTGQTVDHARMCLGLTPQHSPIDRLSEDVNIYVYMHLNDI